MSTIIDWVDQINKLKILSVNIGVPIDVEIDKNSRGNVDGKIILEDIPVAKTGNIYNLDFNILLEYSTSKKNWNVILNKMQIMSEKLSDDTTFLFGGWNKIEDDTNIIYRGRVILKNITNNF